MKRIRLTDEQLEQVINFHEKGDSWLKIQKQTGIPRRVAQREYEEWEVKQSQQDLDEVRKEVIAEEFRLHLNLLSRLAEAFVDSLSIPDPLNDLADSEEVIARLLKEDVYQDSQVFLPESEEKKEKRIMHMNTLLFKALQEHTKNHLSWGILDKWKASRNKVIEDLKDIENKISEIFNNILHQPEQKKVKNTLQELDPQILKDITRGILLNVYLNKINRHVCNIESMKGTSMSKQGTCWVKFHRDLPEWTNVTFRDSDQVDSESLAKEVVRISEWVVKNLFEAKQEQLMIVKNEIKKMEEYVGKLEEDLNPLVLRPVILNTRCEICPV
jgi:hypothetical protein